MRAARRARGSSIAVSLAAAAIVLWSVVPIIWMVLTAVKPAEAVRTREIVLFFSATVDNVVNLFARGNQVGSFLVNSVLVTGASTALAVALGCLAGYGLAHWQSPRKADVSFWIISTRMAPIAAVSVPLFVMFREAGLVNTIPGLVIAHLSFTLPFAIWMMSAFFAQVPRSVEEAALVDGCTRFGTFWRVALPAARPGVITTAVLCMVFSWNDYAFSSTLGGPGTSTLPTAAGALVTQTGIDWGLLCALGVVVATPTLVAGLAVRRHLVTGLSLGAVTGE